MKAGSRLKIRFALMIFSCVAFADVRAQSAGATAEFRLDFPPVPQARYYEIEWFTTDVSGEENPTPGLQERFDAPPFVKRVASDLKFFRTRAIGAYDLPGAWSPILPVPVFLDRVVKQDIFRTVQRSDGATEDYFTGDTIGLTATDDSGKATIYYSVNDSEFQVYTGRIRFDQDGPYLLRYYAIDAAGNREAMRQARFLVDRHPPQTQVNFATALVENNGQIFTGPNNTIALEAADDGSGVAAIRYRIFKAGEARAAFTDYSGPISLSKDVLTGESATFAIEFYAIDRLGNREPARVLFIRQSDFAQVNDA